jgi:outer membrane receptor for Fe3+-dicitrate
MRDLSWLSTDWQRWLLLAIMVTVARASGVDAQPAPRPNAQPPAEVLQLPEVTVRAPARLPEPPLRLSEVPATVQVITGEELRHSGVMNLQEVLTRLPGVTLHDEQGNAA